jgi:cysteinyl-tRNA synthetase
MNHYYAARTKKAPLYKEDARAFAAFIDIVRRTFGCFESVSEAVPSAVQALLIEREKARAAKDFAASDRLRDEIKALGYEVRDAGGKQTVKKF